MSQDNARRKRKLAPGLLVLWFYIAITDAAVYKWVDEKGKIHYSDTRPEQVKAIEEEVEIQNEQMQFMDEREKRVLEKYDEQREIEANKRKEPVTVSPPEEVVAAKDKRHKCFSSSPSLTATGISEVEFSPRLLTENERESLDHIFEEIDGRWRGEIKGYVCLGKEEAPRTRPDNFEVTINANVDSSGNMHFKSILQSKTQGKNRKELYDFYVQDNLLRYSSSSSGGDVLLTNLNRKGFSFIQRYWRNGRLVENVISINLIDNGFSMEKLHYHQGLLGAVSVWTLDNER